jgi:hypothetical protein
MFLLYIALMCFAVAGLFVWIAKWQGDDDFICITIFCSIAGLIFLTITFISSMVAYSDQLSDIEDLQKIDKTRAILQDKSNVLTTQFAKYLAELYPNQEKDIFNKISPKDVSIYLVKYPEIKSADTIIKLVDQINQLQSSVYAQDIQKQELLKDMRYRQVNPWIFHSWVKPYVEAQ